MSHNSVQGLQQLQKHVRAKQYPKQVQVFVRNATAKLNWSTYETLKAALGLGLVHGPKHDLLNAELTFLQDLGGKVDKPPSGPVTTKDVADCLAIVVYELIGTALHSYMEQLGGLTPSASLPGGIPLKSHSAASDDVHARLSGFGRSRPPGVPRGPRGPR